MRRGLLPTLALAVVPLWAGCGDLGALEEQAPVALDCGAPGTICTVVGNGSRAFSGEGAQATQAALYFPIDVAFDPQGRLCVLDWNNQRIRRLDQDGHLRTIMGDGTEGEVLEGVPARQHTLHHAYSLAFDAAGNLFIAGFHVPYALQVDTAGLVHIAAGDGQFGYSGDGGPARAGRLNSPQGVAVHPSGAPLWIADTGNHCIRQVDAAGIITTVAGNGQPGYSGDGGPAAQARLWYPSRVRYDASTNSLLVADTQNQVIRRVAQNGTITTVAGTGQAGFGGDGGPATQARLNLPQDAIAAADGSIYIADAANNRIRRVLPDGTITTFAGNGSETSGGDGAGARDAGLGRPSALVIDGTGDLWVADTFGCRVRRIAR